MEEFEKELIENIKKEFASCKDSNSVNKMYRHCRIWSRFHCYLGNGCTPEHAKELNLLFKSLRFRRLAELNGVVAE